jgi:hypothetical protein
MAPVIDVHTHWLSARRFPELALSGAAIPDVLPDGTARLVNDGVSSLIYPDMFDDAKQEQVARQAGLDLRILTRVLFEVADSNHGAVMAYGKGSDPPGVCTGGRLGGVVSPMRVTGRHVR